MRVGNKSNYSSLLFTQKKQHKKHLQSNALP